MLKSKAAAGEHVVLHVYEPAKEGPSLPGFGVFHTGIEFSDSGVEYCYAGAPGAPGTGVQEQRPKQTPDQSQWKFKESIDLGRTAKTRAQIAAMLDELRREFMASDYDVVHNNCNHFTSTVCSKLGDVKYPGHINRAARWGSFFMDNPIKDRQRKEALAKAEEEKKKNPFLNSKGRSLEESAGVAVKSPTTTAATNVSGSGGSSGGRPNPWRDPNFMPSKK